ncbi:hypothetical protein [Streptomyces celluloflavus]|uniref:hypothetical protein n=1 Tax=Streptomyces celluloflavus TaxID=58344 RepID=UPI0036951712
MAGINHTLTLRDAEPTDDDLLPEPVLTAAILNTRTSARRAHNRARLARTRYERLERHTELAPAAAQFGRGSGPRSQGLHTHQCDVAAQNPGASHSSAAKGIRDRIAARNADPKPCIRTKPPTRSLNASPRI